MKPFEDWADQRPDDSILVGETIQPQQAAFQETTFEDWVEQKEIVLEDKPQHDQAPGESTVSPIQSPDEYYEQERQPSHLISSPGDKIQPPVEDDVEHFVDSQTHAAPPSHESENTYLQQVPADELSMTHEISSSELDPSYAADEAHTESQFIIEDKGQIYEQEPVESTLDKTTVAVEVLGEYQPEQQTISPDQERVYEEKPQSYQQEPMDTCLDDSPQAPVVLEEYQPEQQFASPNQEVVYEEKSHLHEQRLMDPTVDDSQVPTAVLEHYQPEQRPVSTNQEVAYEEKLLHEQEAAETTLDESQPVTEYLDEYQPQVQTMTSDQPVVFEEKPQLHEQEPVETTLEESRPTAEHLEAYQPETQTFTSDQPVVFEEKPQLHEQEPVETTLEESRPTAEHLEAYQPETQTFTSDQPVVFEEKPQRHEQEPVETTLEESRPTTEHLEAYQPETQTFTSDQPVVFEERPQLHEQEPVETTLEESQPTAEHLEAYQPETQTFTSDQPVVFEEKPQLHEQEPVETTLAESLPTTKYLDEYQPEAQTLSSEQQVLFQEKRHTDEQEPAHVLDEFLPPTEPTTTDDYLPAQTCPTEPLSEQTSPGEVTLKPYVDEPIPYEDVDNTAGMSYQEQPYQEVIDDTMEPEMIHEFSEGEMFTKEDVEEKEETSEDGSTIRTRIITIRYVKPVKDLTISEGEITNIVETEELVGTEVEEEIVQLSPGVDEPFGDNLQTQTTVEECEETLPDGTWERKKITTTTVCRVKSIPPAEAEQVSETVAEALDEVIPAAASVSVDSAEVVYKPVLPEDELPEDASVETYEEQLPDGRVVRKRVICMRVENILIIKTVTQFPDGSTSEDVIKEEISDADTVLPEQLTTLQQEAPVAVVKELGAPAEHVTDKFSPIELIESIESPISELQEADIKEAPIEDAHTTDMPSEDTQVELVESYVGQQAVPVTQIDQVSAEDYITEEVSFLPIHQRDGSDGTGELQTMSYEAETDIGIPESDNELKTYTATEENQELMIADLPETVEQLKQEPEQHLPTGTPEQLESQQITPAEIEYAVKEQTQESSFQQIPDVFDLKSEAIVDAPPEHIDDASTGIVLESTVAIQEITEERSTFKETPGSAVQEISESQKSETDTTAIETADILHEVEPTSVDEDHSKVEPKTEAFPSDIEPKMTTTDITEEMIADLPEMVEQLKEEPEQHLPTGTSEQVEAQQISPAEIEYAVKEQTQELDQESSFQQIPDEFDFKSEAIVDATPEHIDDASTGFVLESTVAIQELTEESSTLKETLDSPVLETSESQKSETDTTAIEIADILHEVEPTSVDEDQSKFEPKTETFPSDIEPKMTTTDNIEEMIADLPEMVEQLKEEPEQHLPSGTSEQVESQQISPAEIEYAVKEQTQELDQESSFQQIPDEFDLKSEAIVDATPEHIDDASTGFVLESTVAIQELTEESSTFKETPDSAVQEISESQKSETDTTAIEIADILHEVEPTSVNEDQSKFEPKTETFPSDIEPKMTTTDNIEEMIADLPEMVEQLKEEPEQHLPTGTSEQIEAQQISPAEIEYAVKEQTQELDQESSFQQIPDEFDFKSEAIVDATPEHIDDASTGFVLESTVAIQELTEESSTLKETLDSPVLETSESQKSETDTTAIEIADILHEVEPTSVDEDQSKFEPKTETFPSDIEPKMTTTDNIEEMIADLPEMVEQLKEEPEQHLPSGTSEQVESQQISPAEIEYAVKEQTQELDQESSFQQIPDEFDLKSEAIVDATPEHIDDASTGFVLESTVAIQELTEEISTFKETPDSAVQEISESQKSETDTTAIEIADILHEVEPTSVDEDQSNVEPKTETFPSDIELEPTMTTADNIEEFLPASVEPDEMPPGTESMPSDIELKTTISDETVSIEAPVTDVHEIQTSPKIDIEPYDNEMNTTIEQFEAAPTEVYSPVEQDQESHETEISPSDIDLLTTIDTKEATATTVMVSKEMVDETSPLEETRFADIQETPASPNYEVALETAIATTDVIEEFKLASFDSQSPIEPDSQVLGTEVFQTDIDLTTTVDSRESTITTVTQDIGVERSPLDKVPVDIQGTPASPTTETAPWDIELQTTIATTNVFEEFTSTSTDEAHLVAKPDIMSPDTNIIPLAQTIVSEEITEVSPLEEAPLSVRERPASPRSETVPRDIELETAVTTTDAIDSLTSTHEVSSEFTTDMPSPIADIRQSDIEVSTTKIVATEEINKEVSYIQEPQVLIHETPALPKTETEPSDIEAITSPNLADDLTQAQVLEAPPPVELHIMSPGTDILATDIELVTQEVVTEKLSLADEPVVVRKTSPESPSGTVPSDVELKTTIITSDVIEEYGQTILDDSPALVGPHMSPGTDILPSDIELKDTVSTDILTEEFPALQDMSDDKELHEQDTGYFPVDDISKTTLVSVDIIQDSSPPDEVSSPVKKEFREPEMESPKLETPSADLELKTQSKDIDVKTTIVTQEVMEETVTLEATAAIDDTTTASQEILESPQSESDIEYETDIDKDTNIEIQTTVSTDELPANDETAPPFGMDMKIVTKDIIEDSSPPEQDSIVITSPEAATLPSDIELQTTLVTQEISKEFTPIDDVLSPVQQESPDLLTKSETTDELVHVLAGEKLSETELEISTTTVVAEDVQDSFIQTEDTPSESSLKVSTEITTTEVALAEERHLTEQAVEPEELAESVSLSDEPQIESPLSHSPDIDIECDTTFPTQTLTDDYLTDEQPPESEQTSEEIHTSLLHEKMLEPPLESLLAQSPTETLEPISSIPVATGDEIMQDEQDTTPDISMFQADTLPELAADVKFPPSVTEHIPSAEQAPLEDTVLFPTEVRPQELAPGADITIEDASLTQELSPSQQIPHQEQGPVAEQTLLPTEQASEELLPSGDISFSSPLEHDREVSLPEPKLTTMTLPADEQILADQTKLQEQFPGTDTRMEVTTDTQELSPPQQTTPQEQAPAVERTSQTEQVPEELLPDVSVASSLEHGQEISVPEPNSPEMTHPADDQVLPEQAPLDDTVLLAIEVPSSEMLPASDAPITDMPHSLELSQPEQKSPHEQTPIVEHTLLPTGQLAEELLPSDDVSLSPSLQRDHKISQPKSKSPTMTLPADDMVSPESAQDELPFDGETLSSTTEEKSLSLPVKTTPTEQKPLDDTFAPPQSQSPVAELTATTLPVDLTMLQEKHLEEHAIPAPHEQSPAEPLLRDTQQPYDEFPPGQAQELAPVTQMSDMEQPAQMPVTEEELQFEQRTFVESRQRRDFDLPSDDMQQVPVTEEELEFESRTFVDARQQRDYDLPGYEHFTIPDDKSLHVQVSLPGQFPDDFEEYEETLPDGTIVTRRVSKTKVKKIVTRKIRRVGPDGEVVEDVFTEEVPDSEVLSETSSIISSTGDYREISSPVPSLSPTDLASPYDSDSERGGVRVYTDTVEGEPQVETDIQEFEETLPDGTVVRRKVIKTKQKQTIVKRVVMEGPENELPASEEQAQEYLTQAFEPGYTRYTDTMEGDPESHTDVQEFEETLDDGTVIKRRVVTTTEQQLKTERTVLEGEELPDFEGQDQAFHAIAEPDIEAEMQLERPQAGFHDYQEPIDDDIEVTQTTNAMSTPQQDEQEAYEDEIQAELQERKG